MFQFYNNVQPTETKDKYLLKPCPPTPPALSKFTFRIFFLFGFKATNINTILIPKSKRFDE